MYYKIELCVLLGIFFACEMPDLQYNFVYNSPDSIITNVSQNSVIENLHVETWLKMVTT